MNDYPSSDTMAGRPPLGDRIFVVVAAYNEERSIKGVTDRLLAEYPNVVVVDDGSTDSTSDRIRDSSVCLLRHIINRGQGAALQTGIQFALLKGAEIIVTFDADGQHDVQDIPALVEPVLSGQCDVALGSRFLGRAQNIPLARRLVLRGGILFTRIVSGIAVTDVHNGLRAFSREAASLIRIRMDRMAHASEILDQIKALGLKYKEVPVNISYTAYSLGKGQSSWNAIKIAFQILQGRVTR